MDINIDVNVNAGSNSINDNFFVNVKLLNATAIFSASTFYTNKTITTLFKRESEIDFIAIVFNER